MMLWTAILFILFEAVFEGLLNWTTSAFRDFIFKGWVQLTICILLFVIWFVFIAIPFDDYFVPIAKLILGFVFVRFGIFDITYNFSAGKIWNYYGDKKWYDQQMQKLGGFGWFLKFFVFGPMGVVFLMGIS